MSWREDPVHFAREHPHVREEGGNLDTELKGYLHVLERSPCTLNSRPSACPRESRSKQPKTAADMNCCERHYEATKQNKKRNRSVRQVSECNALTNHRTNILWSAYRCLVGRGIHEQCFDWTDSQVFGLHFSITVHVKVSCIRLCLGRKWELVL